ARAASAIRPVSTPRIRRRSRRSLSSRGIGCSGIRRVPVPLQSPILTVSGNQPGRSVVIANMLCDKIAAEADAFTHTRWRKIVFTFPGVRESVTQKREPLVFCGDRLVSGGAHACRV